MSSEALWLFKQLNLHLELEGRFQPREKGLSLIEGAAEVGEGVGGAPQGRRRISGISEKIPANRI